MLTIVTIVGARPQFIKAAPVSKAIRGAGHREILVHTGQHYDHAMSQIFFDELEIHAPDMNLGVGSGSHGKQTGQMLADLERLIDQQRPDWVIIYGDTNSTLAGALAASKLHVSVAHVEAGLRSFNRRMPEEINRVVADHLSNLLLCPTRQAVENLKQEGITQGVVHVGDVMFDAALCFGDRARQRSNILQRLGLEPKQYRFATVHRAENTDDRQRLTSILEALNILAEEFPVVFPVHPRTRKMIDKHELQFLTQRLTLMEPLSFLDTIRLEQEALLILTDSGGVQKEAYFQRVPCVTLRDETEWVETVESGWNQLAGTSTKGILQRAVAAGPGNTIEEYGVGNSAEEIVRQLERI